MASRNDLAPTGRPAKDDPPSNKPSATEEAKTERHVTFSPPPRRPHDATRKDTEAPTILPKSPAVTKRTLGHTAGSGPEFERVKAEWRNYLAEEQALMEQKTREALMTAIARNNARH